MGKNRSASGITNVIQYDNNGNIAFVSGSTTLMQVSSSGAITTTGVISGSNALSASFSLNSALLNGTGSVGFATTASLLTVSSSQQQISASQQQLSSSFLTLTASFNAVSSSQQQISASYIALSASYNTFSGSASTRITENSSSIQQVSASQQQISSSQQQISSSLLNVISIFATTGSNSFRATQSITGSLTVTGQIIAQTLNVQQVTSSIIYSSGSNNFGCDLNSRQTFTGSVFITGSTNLTGALNGTDASFSSAANTILTLDSTNTNGYTATQINYSGTAKALIGYGTYLTTDGGVAIRTAASTPFTIAIGGATPNFTITSTGAAAFACSVTTGGELSVGTGTLSADRMMQVSGTSFTSGASQFAAVFNPTFGNNITNLYGIYISLTSGTSVTNRYQLYVDGGGGTATNDYAIYSANTAKSYFAGNVGIGTNAPTSISTYTTLEIRGTTGGGIKIGKTACSQFNIQHDGTDAYFNNTANGALYVYTSDAERMRITSAGIACFACQVCSPTFKGGSFNGTTGYFSCHIELNDNGSGWIYGYDKNHSIILRGDRNGCTSDYTNYYQYGGNLSTCKGHNFWTDGVLASQTIKMQIANNGICMTVPLYVCNTIVATGATIASDIVGDPVYLRVRNNNTGGYPSSLALSLYGYSSSPAGYYDVLRIQGSYPGYGSANFIVKEQSQSADVIALTIRGTGITCFGFTVCAPCFATISDYRMKSNLRPIEGLSIIMNTKPYKFEYNYDCSTSFGMIAHELQDALPEAVFGQKDGEVMQGVDYMKLLPITIKAIQEQQCIINTLKTCLGIA